RKRKAGSPSLHKKVKGQENWKQMSRSSIVALENIMDLAILSTLASSQREKKEIQEQLNILKKRFIAHAAQLKVPVNKQKELECSSHRHQDETKKFEAGKKALSSLEENLKSVLILLEKTEEETVTLEERCRTLRDQLEGQEEEAKEVRTISVKCCNLLFCFIQSRMKNIIPAADSETMARKLGEILQNAKAIQDAQELLLQAHKHADQLFKP
uniref:Centromere protein Q n=1 Tax=Sphaeramia orbicularis TaxID=375764 RepID=A0A673AEJ4_9TELE